MRQRFLLALLLAFALITFGAGPQPNAAVAQSADTTKLTVVRAAYDGLLDLFFRPLEPVALLAAGWEALDATAAEARLPTPPPLASLPSGRDAAFAAFSQTYLDYAAGLASDEARTLAAFIIADGMAESLEEQHTNFLPPAAYRNFLAQLGGSQLPVGLGIRSTARPQRIVTGIAPGGPGERAGVLVGDVIIAVNGRDVSGATQQEFAQALAGPAGTTHTITVDRGGPPVDLRVTRGSFYFPPLSSRMLPAGVGYLRLDSFVQSGAVLPNGTEFLSDLDRRLDELDGQGAQALIIDLRGNGGGDVFTTAEFLGRFLPEDALSVVRSDQRGHVSVGIVSGQMRRVQHPMVILVDQGSFSSSEVSAATFRETDRALLVGSRTGGSLATSQVLPLPEGAGLQVALAEQVTVRSQFKIDEVGYPVDLEVEDTRTAADYRAGYDPQLEAALAAVADAPPPPAFKAAVTSQTPADLRALLSRYMPTPDQVPTNDRLRTVMRTGTRDFTHPNQSMNYAALGARDPLALQQAIRGRGWLGSHITEFGPELLVPPYLSVVIDVYATSAGAAEAVRTNDYPDVQEAVPAPMQLGEQTVAYRGSWIALGGVGITWRRENVVLSVSYTDVPGFERMETVAAMAQVVDALYRQNPLPAQKMPAAMSATLQVTPPAWMRPLHALRATRDAHRGVARSSIAATRYEQAAA